MEIIVEYTNQATWDVFGQAPVRYVIRSTLVPSSNYYLLRREVLAGNRRRLISTHGLLVIAQVQGKLRFWSFSMLLQVITTAMALLAGSRMVTNFLMLYLLADRQKFRLLKFQPTLNFPLLREIKDAQRSFARASYVEYNEVEHKPQPASDFLSDIFEDFADDACPDMLEVEQTILERTERKLSSFHSSSWWLDILALVVRHEQRLNRLDGSDESNLGFLKIGCHGEKMAYFYRAWEKHYWQRSGMHSVIDIMNRHSEQHDSGYRSRESRQSEFIALLRPTVTATADDRSTGRPMAEP